MQYDAHRGYVKSFPLRVESKKVRSPKLDWNVADETAVVTAYVPSKHLTNLYVFSVLPISYKGCIQINQVGDTTEYKIQIYQLLTAATNDILLNFSEKNYRFYANNF